MFGSSKPVGSLSSGLLARKGQARPAMRPQGYVGVTPGAPIEDLGWNDMGEGGDSAVPAAKPPVLSQREALSRQLTPGPACEPVAEAGEPARAAPHPSPAESGRSAPAISANTLVRIGRELADQREKAAFTLRLDHDRHLRLRLASAITHRSAQQLVTEALDALLDSLPQVDVLASQVVGHGRDGKGK